jgi:hypothetical protein
MAVMSKCKCQELKEEGPTNRRDRRKEGKIEF